MGQTVTGMFMTSLHIATVLELEEVLVPPVAALTRAFDRAGRSAFARRLRGALARIDEAEEDLHEIAVGGSDELSGMSKPDWHRMAATIVSETKRPFIAPPDGLAEAGSPGAVVGAMAAVRGLAITLLDISGHLADLAQSAAVSASLEAMSMVCINVIGLDQVVAIARVRGSTSRRVLRPIVVMSVLNAVRTLGLACAPVTAIEKTSRGPI
jgi:fumarate hydratase class II